MRSQRDGRLGSSMAAAALVLVATAATARAQPGFGPDPFWPYNNQYTPYVTNVGPAGPEGGQGGAMNLREGYRGANQFQEYLESLQGGPGRNLSDRSNIGMPYYRSAVDPAYETRGRGPRQYQANTRADESFDNSQRRVADIYFRYFSERDPARRADLLREYREARREAALAISGRGRSASRGLEATARRGAGLRRSARTGEAPAATRSGRAGRSQPEKIDRIGPAPEVPAIGSRRSTGSSPRAGRSSPADILRRSRAMDRSDRDLPVSGAPSFLPRPMDRGAAPPPPRSSATRGATAAPPRNPAADNE